MYAGVRKRNLINKPENDRTLLFVNGEVGRVASIQDENHCFVCYHTGETAARTPNKNMDIISKEEAISLIENYSVDDLGGERFKNLDKIS